MAAQQIPQPGVPFGTIVVELDVAADCGFVVHNAAGIISVQARLSVTQALIRLRAHAFSHDRPIKDVAHDPPIKDVAADIVARNLRLS